MSTTVDSDISIEYFLADGVPSQAFSAPLPDAFATEVVERLKQEADRHWYIDPRRSLAFADRIVAIGEARGDTRQIALGLMARGDALKFLGQVQEAWEALEHAGNMFQAAGDEVGWARTRIGRLYLSFKMNRVAGALADAERAGEIFTRHGERERLIPLNLNVALVYSLLGDPRRALSLYHSILEIAEALGDAGQRYLGHLYTNIGLTYDTLGDFRQALAYYQKARTLLEARNETRTLATIEINIAYIARAQGHYRRALDVLHNVLSQVSDKYPTEAAWARCDLVECYLHLNRYAEARDLARQVIGYYRASNDAYELARTLLHLATAEAELGNLAGAEAALDEAEPIFVSLGATTWVARIRLWRGRMALKRGDVPAAYQDAVTAATCFQAGGEQINYAIATVLRSQALLASDDLEAAAEGAMLALRIAQHDNVPSLRYAAHLLLGQIAEARHDARQSERRYRAAEATIDRVQRGLTITLRPGFLEDKGEARRALIALQLREGHVENAFETVERAKSQVLLGYLANREHLHWTQDDSRSRTLIDELDQLRAEHQWFYQLAHDPPRSIDHPSAVRPEQALAEVAVRERRMRVITEQLYLRNSGEPLAIRASAASLSDVQCTLDEEALLVEFYSDGVHLWAFVLNGQTLDVRRLPIEMGVLNQLLAQIKANMAAALKVAPQSPAVRNLTYQARRILQRLYSLLIEPLELERHCRQRLVIVPYGVLHYLPFHLLYDGSAHLIERYEVVVLPAAGLATRPGPQRRSGALILSHSWDGRLPHTLAEAQMVQRLFGGALYVEEAARRATLQTQPGQILHIAAHGQHRLDQPDMSYLQLADGQLYADDLLQQDLSYELVTLSACETGRANVAADEELIGIGRGFLYTGAGALILSLWGVSDVMTVELMTALYGGLRRGVSKAAALREAQQSILSQDPELHPAFWGAFQLIGDPRPLSTAPV